ncbi:MAG: hypothetical protein ABR529_06635 [Actinomycetota bacterium]
MSKVPPDSGRELDAAQRTLRARLAAHTRWSMHDRKAGTEAAREAFRSRFERQVDPQGILPLEERQKRAESARRAYFARLSLASARARAKR